MNYFLNFLKLRRIMKKFRLSLIGIFSLVFSTPESRADYIPAGPELLKQVQAEIINIDTAELKRRLEQDPNLTLIDVRNPNEINQFGGTLDADQNVILQEDYWNFGLVQFSTLTTNLSFGIVASINGAHLQQRH